MKARLRQAVWAARELEPVVAALRAELGAGEPYADPGVAEFGLRNAVCALGDTFLEVISPERDDAPAARWLARRGGDGGYMLLIQVDDLEGARRRAEELGIRAVWRIDLPDIAATHLHPADLGGTLLSVDRPDPPGSWRWGGPDWTGRAGEGPAGRLVGATVAVGDPERVAACWGEVLGLPTAPGHNAIALDDGWIEFAPGAPGGEGLVELAVTVPPERRRQRDDARIAGVRVRFLDRGPGQLPQEC